MKKISYEELDTVLGTGNYRHLSTVLKKPNGKPWVRIHLSKVLRGETRFSVDLIDELIRHTRATYEDIKGYIQWVKGGKDEGSI